MTTHTLSPVRAAVMEKVGQGIIFNSDRQKLILEGRRFKPSKPQRLVKARDVRVTIKKGFLVGPGKNDSSRRVAEVVFEQDTDRVVSVEERF